MNRRNRVLHALRRSIERSSSPRWHLSLILAITGAFAFVSSVLLLRLGIVHMGWRYVLCFALAYPFFLLCLWLWACTYRKHGDSSDPSDIADAADFIPDLPGPSRPGPLEGDEGAFDPGGGEFGGGGATSSWDTSEVGDAVASGLSLDADEGSLFLIPLAIAIGAVFSGFVAIALILHSAPVLLAELVLEVAILGGVYRRLRGVEAEHWLWPALRHTWRPALALFVLVAVIGFFLAATSPEAITLGEALARD